MLHFAYVLAIARVKLRVQPGLGTQEAMKPAMASAVGLKLVQFLEVYKSRPSGPFNQHDRVTKIKYKYIDYQWPMATEKCKASWGNEVIQ